MTKKLDSSQRLEAYRQLLAQDSDDDHRRGSTLTQAGSPDRYSKWTHLLSTYAAHLLVARTDYDDL